VTTSVTAPFPGLRPFTRADAPWFFGRPKQIAALRDRLDRHRFLAVVGGSGVGKSSLVYAGLLPRLEEETNWWCLEMMPRGAPRNALCRSFINLLLQAGLIDAAEAASAPLIDHIHTTLRRSAFGLIDLVSDWFPSSGRRLLLLVDQFEELFRFGSQGTDVYSTEDEAAPFVSSLLMAAATTRLPVHVIVTMRADYIGDCIRFEGLPEAVSDGQYLVPRLTREDIESVIREPIRRAGASIDHDLVEQLLNDSARQSDALPVLQHVLMCLWDASRPESDQRRLTLDTYNAVGRMRDALSLHADRVIDDLRATALGEKADSLVAQIMRALTEVDHRGRGIRRPVPFSQLVAETGFSKPEVTLVADAMRSEGRSFLRPDAEVALTDDTVIDIGHEALIRLWRKIEDRDAIDYQGRSKGWLRAEERDGRIYRALLEYADESERGDGAPLPPGQAQSRLEWWNQLKRTEHWARRYGGGWARVVRLLERSMSAGDRTFAATSVAAPVSPENVEETRARATDLLAVLRGKYRDEDLLAAKRLIRTLRNQQEHELICQLAEAISRIDRTDIMIRRLYAQSLIDTGRVTLAIDVLQRLTTGLLDSGSEYSEIIGLLGRSYKQIFLDADDKTSAGACEALNSALEFYYLAYERDPQRNTWHGANVVALLTRARALGLPVKLLDDPKAIAKRLVATLEAIPTSERDEWALAQLIEASLGLGDWDAVDSAVEQYLATTNQAFFVANTLRQLTEVWDLEKAGPRGRDLIDLLRAYLLRLSGAELRLAPSELSRIRSQPEPQQGVYEKILGRDGAQTFQWWQTGMKRASSIASIRMRLGERIATGFLLRAGDLGLKPASELLLLTTFYVVNADGTDGALRPDDAVVVFEGVAPDRAYAVAEVVWSSPVDRHDASLLRLDPPVTGISPLPIAAALPPVNRPARVYIIGHAGGRELSFSLQDNELLDHEGPPAGHPQIAGVCRVHYRAPTEGGSSGSPVFNASSWEVIAMHHKGGMVGMPRLNGAEGTYGANEGISMQSIIDAIHS
jgi:hypothetical protein